MEIHAAVVLAVQVQSRLVEIARELEIPSAGAASRVAFSTATSHFAAVGALTEMDEDVPLQAVAKNHSAQIANGRARMACDAPCKHSAARRRTSSGSIRSS
jgi:hypothetical protein